MATGNSSRQKYSEMEIATKAVVMVPGSFQANNTADVSNARGDGFSADDTDVGEFTITFAELYPQCISFVVSVEDADSDGDVLDLVATSEAYDPATGSILVRLSTADGTPAAADFADVRINFVACFQKYSALAVTHA